MADIDLTMIASLLREVQEQLRAVQTDTTALRDDMTVLSGIVRRLDRNMAVIVQDILDIRGRVSELERSPQP